ncbi:MAG TPA: hypothetical protein VGS03_07670 [Candidatus Polarisedimenticolia bacterium]|jgi:hypothetical protein|nr:hypothetical protein [Candidatus Polarisedimenticolia bacterium]
MGHRWELAGGETRLGPTWYIAVLFLAAAFLFLLKVRSTEFVHGEELAWAVGYLVPLLGAILSLGLSLFHLVRRTRRLLAWVPVLASCALGSWLIAYLFFDAFRSR